MSLQQEFLDNGFILVRRVLAADVAAALADEVGRVAFRASTLIDRPARAGGDERLSYRVVPGDRIRAQLPALFDLYTAREMVDWVRLVTGSPAVGLSPHLRSSINVNCLSRPEQAYPRHVDAVPYTAILFLTSLPGSAGGELQILSLRGRIAEIRPEAGALVVMDGARCAHAVAPLRRDMVRLTVPMVYPAQRHERPDGLDDYLYGDDSTRGGT